MSNEECAYATGQTWPAQTLLVDAETLGSGKGEVHVMNEGLFRTVLMAHWLAGVECNETSEEDRASCACSTVNLGWQSNVGTAVETWIDHVMRVAAVTPDTAGWREWTPVQQGEVNDG